MSDLEITTAIACWALALSLFGFFIGVIYNTKQIKKLKEQLDKEVCGFNRRLKLLNNSVYGNIENNCQGSIERRLAQLELNIDKHSDLLNNHMDAINKLARHTEYPKSKIV